MQAMTPQSVYIQRKGIKVMKCTKCNCYSFALRRCTLGRINPNSVKGCVEAARVMGWEYICEKCDSKTKAKIKHSKGE